MDSPVTDSFDCIVIGGGLVGAALAYGLAKRNLRTAVLDEGDVALRASRGNFGLVWVQGKGRDRPEYARWSRGASELWPEFASELQELTGIDVPYTRKGGVALALSERELEDTVLSLQAIRQQLGADYEFEAMQPAKLKTLLPGIGPGVAGGTYCPYDGHTNPLRLLRALHAGFAARGGRYFGSHKVTRVNTRPDGGFRIDGGGSLFEAAKIVVAAGLGSRDLAPRVGLSLPVEPVQGQLLVTERAQPLFDYPTNIVRQTDEGTFLLGDSHAEVGFDTATRPQTLRDIASRCSKAFPFLGKLRVVRSWSALRVMTPDGFPIYDSSASHPGAYGVTCHSGVTLAANHALRVAGWIAADAIPDEFDCFRAAGGRFDVPTTT